jgi:membrane-associated protein
VDIASAGLYVIVGLILVKEAGLPFPVPGDLIVIGAGIAAGRGDLDPVTTLVLIVLASVIGGAIQYTLLRSVARPALMRLLGRITSVDRIERQAERLRGGGARSVALARSTPGIRIVVVYASALASIPPVAFVTGLAIGNAVFIAAHFGLGFLLGESILAIVGAVLGPLAVAGTATAVAIIVGWYLVVRRRARAVEASTHEPGAFTAWQDACCPACLSLATGRRAEAPAS